MTTEAAVLCPRCQSEEIAGTHFMSWNVGVGTLICRACKHVWSAAETIGAAVWEHRALAAPYARLKPDRRRS